MNIVHALPFDFFGASCALIALGYRLLTFWQDRGRKREMPVVEPSFVDDRKAQNPSIDADVREAPVYENPEKVVLPPTIGRLIVKSSSTKAHKRFKADIYVLSKEEGGRHTAFFSNYRPQFYFRSTDVTGAVKLPEGVEMVMPGEKISLEVELLTPVTIRKLGQFRIREGSRTVGSGRVSEILD